MPSKAKRKGQTSRTLADEGLLRGVKDPPAWIAEQRPLHQFGDAFRLYGLPSPRAAQVLGILGANGCGKSTVLSIFSGSLQPNLGASAPPKDWVRAAPVRTGIRSLLASQPRVASKPQYVEEVAAKYAGRHVGSVLEQEDTRAAGAVVVEQLELAHLWERTVDTLSGGELQRFSIALVCVQTADLYIVDEPSSFLDVRQRLRAARALLDLRAGAWTGRPSFLQPQKHRVALSRRPLRPRGRTRPRGARLPRGHGRTRGWSAQSVRDGEREAGSDRESSEISLARCACPTRLRCPCPTARASASTCFCVVPSLASPVQVSSRSARQSSTLEPGDFCLSPRLSLGFASRRPSPLSQGAATGRAVLALPGGSDHPAGRLPAAGCGGGVQRG